MLDVKRMIALEEVVNNANVRLQFLHSLNNFLIPSFQIILCNTIKNAA